MGFYFEKETIVWVLSLGRRLLCGSLPWEGDYCVGSYLPKEVVVRVLTLGRGVLHGSLPWE